MNYLAHLLLAAPTDSSRIGNLLGDFVKGTPDSLHGAFPPEVLAGIVMHRQLDRFTDDHPAFHHARELLAPHRRRFAGIVVDIFFDHFLSIHWDQFSEQTLPAFIEEIHASLARHPSWLGPLLTEIAPRLRDENWLHSYGTIEGLNQTFLRIASRSTRLDPVRPATDDLLAHYQSFDRAFHQFFPDARAHAAQLLAAGP